MIRPAYRDLALVLLMGLAVAHVALLGWWVVDDAAISFAYARSLASGQGLAPYLGGEQVEGYSNPTWVLLLAMGQRLGVDPFSTSKALSFALVAATVPLVHALAGRVDRAAGLPAAILFAANTQVAVFGACGLENPLLWFLLALGLWGLAGEIEAPQAGARFPWSAVAFAALGASRPEGLIHAAAVAPWALRGPAGLRWLAGVALLSGGYQLARYSWFSWPFPMTYYAKIHSGPEALVRWQGPGWQYLRGFLLELGRLAALPVVIAGAVGATRWRLILGALAGGAALWALPAAARWLGPPSAITLLGIGAGLALPASKTSGWAVRGPCWSTGLAAALFALQSGGDWMSGHRWLAITAVPGAVLGALGLVDLARAAPRPIGIGGGIAALGAFVASNVAATVDWRADPETSAFMVGKRVRTIRELLGRLHLDERPICMTFDLGGFLWWSGMEMVDAMGLTDVAVAMHKDRGPEFWDSYLEERRPHVLYRVGARAGADLVAGRVLGERYLEAGRGIRIRRDLVFEPAWSGSPDPEIPLGGVVLVGLELPEPQAAAGAPVRIDLGLRSTGGRAFTSELVLGDDRGQPIAAWPAEPAYGFLAPPLWRPDEVFHGRYTVALPADLALGSHPLGVRIDGAVIWTGDRIEVVDPPTAVAAAAESRARALALASSGRCEEADRAGLRDPEGTRARARCWLDRTDLEPSDRVLRARRIDPSVPGLTDLARPLAEQRLAEGLLARRRGEYGLAFSAFSDALRLEPGLPRARRHLEEVRFPRNE